jgi:signal transduction histidine kinase
VQKYDYPYFADWFAISLRWMVILGVAFSLLAASIFNLPLTILALVGTIWNFFITLLAIFNRRIIYHRILNVGVDFVLTSLLFFFSKGLGGPLVWISLLSLFSAGIYFGMLGSLVLSVMVTLIQIGGLFLFQRVHLPIEFLAMLAGFNLLAGALFGFLNQQLVNRLRKHYESLVKKRDEADRSIMLNERGRMQDFYEMVETLSATLNFETVLETALDLCRMVLESFERRIDTLVGCVLLFDEMGLYVGASRGFPQSDLRLRLPGRDGVLGEAVQYVEPILIGNTSNDPELKRMVGLSDCQSVFCMPLNRGLDAFGIMLFASPERDFFGSEQREMLELISRQVVVSIQNAKLLDELEEEKNHLIKTQEEERKLLARELHDGPIQNIAGIAMRVEYIRRLMDHPEVEGDIQEELVQVENLARKTTQEMRHMLFTLRPLILEKEGLLDALQALAQRMKDVYQQNVMLELDPDLTRGLDQSKQTVIFQLSEEAVNNARKHARASLINVSFKRLTRDKDIALLEISDNGVGFDVKSVAGSYHQRSSLGMVNLQERAELINGRLHIDSDPGKGTRVVVAVPLTDEAADRLHRGLVKE